MTIQAHAKINLTLEVFGKRADGYHALRSLVVPISLADTIEVTATGDGAITSDSPYPDDLCVKAAHALQRRLPWCARACSRENGEAPKKGAHIHVEKRIPAGGGLGGGSADAAAVIVALNELWGCGLDRASLLDVAAEVGSDVPALLAGGAVIMEGRGENVTDFGDFPRFYAVLVNPGVFSSTAEVYGKCRPRMTDDAQILYNMRSALLSGDCERIGAAAVNDLALSACGLHPEISEAMEALRRAGVAHPAMTGSGSTVFGLVPSEARGREVAALMEAKGYQAWSVHSSVR